MTHPGISEIIKKYKAFNANIFETWEDYLFLEFYLPTLHKGIKKGTVALMPFTGIYSTKTTLFKRDFTFGIISRLERKIIGQRALIDAVSATEHFMQLVTYRVYRDFSYKLDNSLEAPDQQLKITRIIIDSVDKEEIIERIAEEKIRGIFYGNPADFFEKDKAKIGLNSYIKDNYKLALEQYKEIIARRNIFTHNNGRVDRKYLREVKNTTLKIGEKPVIDTHYLKHSIFILHGLASLVVQQVILNTYGTTNLKHKLKDYIKEFENQYKGK